MANDQTLSSVGWKLWEVGMGNQHQRVFKLPRPTGRLEHVFIFGQG
jgi:hypothetical protein